jgi:hypothetical protein
MSNMEHLKRPLGRRGLAARLLLRRRTDALMHPREHRPEPGGVVRERALPARAGDDEQLARVAQVLLLRATDPHIAHVEAAGPPIHPESEQMRPKRTSTSSAASRVLCSPAASSRLQRCVATLSAFPVSEPYATSTLRRATTPLPFCPLTPAFVRFRRPNP